MLGLGVSKGSTVGVDGVGATPVVTTAETLSTVGATTATLEGSYVDSETASSVGFRFGSDPNNLTVVDGTQDGSKNITADVTGLSDDTLHYYQAFAVNSNGPGYGALKQFTTDEAPAVVENLASDYEVLYDIQFDATEGIHDFEAHFGTTVSRVSSITDEDGITRSNVLKGQADTATGIFWFYDDTNYQLNPTFVDGLNVYYTSYAVEFYLFIPSTNSQINRFDSFAYSNSEAPTFTSTSFSNSEIVGYGSSDVGSWKKVVYGTSDDVDTSFGLRTQASGQSAVTSLGFSFRPLDTESPGDVVYISDVKVYRRDSTAG